MKKEIELHVHPFLGRNTLGDVVEAMCKRELDIVALEALDASLYPLVLEEAKKLYSDATRDDAGVKLPDGKWLLNGCEYETKEGLHILTVGWARDEANSQTEIRKIIDEGLEQDALVILDHPFVDNGVTRTAGHISAKQELFLEELCKEYSGNVALEWNAYCLPWVRFGLKVILNLLGQQTDYYDVNRKVEELSDRLTKDGYNEPVIADTDLHARSKDLLLDMGTSRIIVDVEGECARDIVQSMKQKIFSGDYQNVKRYVGIFHLLRAFCIPILFHNHFEKPRA
ncbi:hypothetical protein AUJ69_00325 [Candidatus Woesearchaeota archaeon CG1_02_47_18]|nr:MAG: hypothetical protein AUJ69_00325 [Candidatus Woesearchaeota archaeon CG1_02_47_18]